MVQFQNRASKLVWFVIMISEKSCFELKMIECWTEVLICLDLNELVHVCYCGANAHAIKAHCTFQT